MSKTMKQCRNCDYVKQVDKFKWSIVMGWMFIIGISMVIIGIMSMSVEVIKDLRDTDQLTLDKIEVINV